MIELQGKYNTAKIYTDNIDNETISQIIELCNQDSMKKNKIRIMPDCHAGAGCVIGTTMTLTDNVIPNLVGVDIGCGMLTVQLKETEINMQRLDDVIRKYVPSGINIHEKKCTTFSKLDNIIAPINKDRALKSVGTLGGGNHFIEIDKDNEGKLYLVIHTGSRHLGIEVCKYYQDLAYKNVKRDTFVPQIKEAIERLKLAGQENKIEQTLNIIRSQKISIPKDLSYISGKAFNDYIHDMQIVQDYASVNRATIAGTIINHMGLTVEATFETIHNYIDIDNMILRKGAVSAELNEKLIIPMNMRDGSLICIGKGNPDWNYSAPHGAGRLMSRSKAKEMISLDDFKETMSNVWTSCVDTSTIDESPFAYKPMDEIIRNIQDTCTIKSIIKPIYNYKSSEMVKELGLIQEEDKER